MNFETVKKNIPATPAFVIDKEGLLESLQALARLKEHSGCKLLYSIKSLPLTSVMELAKPFVDGFSVSSLFEARLADEILGGNGGIHFTSPGMRPDESAEIAALCSHISCNSISQFRQIKSVMHDKASIGLRINPKLSFTADARYDPCRPYSKLGVSSTDALASGLFEHIKGIHFHTVFSATDYAPLITTLAKLLHEIGDKLGSLDWINLGGGYLYGQMPDSPEFNKMVKYLKYTFDLEVYIEPGSSIVDKAGYLIASVIDCFESDGKTVAVLDTSVNHLPRVFEYQFNPQLHEHAPDGAYPALLAGCTCLAGDLFGDYRFNRPVQVGDKVVFKQVGAYSLVKASRFNGVNLPDVYEISDSTITRLKQHSYQDFRRLWIR